jgi:D-alanine-D-alanine ligase
MTRVLVLLGGNSDEREVSLRSGAAVKAALGQKGFEVAEFDTANALTKEAVAGYDVVFPVLHGLGGEDGKLQAKLDGFGVRYVGTGAEASALCFDKWAYKQLLAQNNFPVPRGELVGLDGFWNSELIKHPFVLKPNDGGSSIDTIIARESQPQADHNVVQQLFERHGKLLLEELIAGKEMTLAVLGEQALPAIEIIPPESGEFDYENKYNGQSQELCPPVSIAGAAQTEAQKLALAIHKLTGCRDFSRTDIMLDEAGNLYVLETNTIPGLTDQSLFPKAAATAGIPMTELVEKLVNFALAR